MNFARSTSSDLASSTRAVSSGFPARIALALAKLSGATVFVETGTYQGATARWAAEYFASVYTIERAEPLFKAHSRALRALDNVEPLLGDSREVLRKIIPGLQGQRAVVWLDGHWSGGETAGAGEECPLIGELEMMASRAHDVIFIDDARLFLCAPPPPHDPRQWPTITEVVAALTAAGPRRYVQIVDDVIIAVPDVSELRNCLTSYARARAEAIWRTSVQGQTARQRTIFARLYGKIRAWLSGEPRRSR